MCLCSSFHSEMIERDQGKNEMCWLLTPPTKVDIEAVTKFIDLRVKSSNIALWVAISSIVIIQ